MTDPTREAFDSDVDLMRDVYMSPSQREAYERILQAALSALAQQGREAGEPVAWMRPEELRHLAKQSGVANADAWNCSSGSERIPLYTAAPKQQAVDVDGLRSALKQAAADLKAYGHLAAAGRALAALTQSEANSHD